MVAAAKPFVTVLPAAVVLVLSEVSALQLGGSACSEGVWLCPVSLAPTQSSTARVWLRGVVGDMKQGAPGFLQNRGDIRVAAVQSGRKSWAGCTSEEGCPGEAEEQLLKVAAGGAADCWCAPSLTPL